MNYKDNSYITAQDLSFAGILRDVKKNQVALQPVFEAFTNSLEAIKTRIENDENFQGEIKLKVFVEETTYKDSYNFIKLSITDNGIGFNEDEFVRFNTFRDESKGFNNLGSGRIQFVHSFDTTTVDSVFVDKGRYYKRKFRMSKKSIFVKTNNAIIFHESCAELETPTDIETTVTFENLIEKSVIYNELNAQTLKAKIIERYIHYLCYNKPNLPKITIEFYVQNKLENTKDITADDIPNSDNTDAIPLYYYKLSQESNKIVKTDKSEKFIIDAFKISKKTLKENKLNLVSKGEIVEESDIKLQNLTENDSIEGFKYLFLVSSQYLNSKDTNERGTLNIPSSAKPDLFTAVSEEIFVEDIQTAVNESIDKMYPEIKKVKENHEEQYQKLKDMFLLKDEIAKDISISINDNESSILKKFYEAEAKKEADLDAEIKKSIDNLDKLDTTSSNYQADLQKEIDNLTKNIPLQNKNSLTRYVARRTLVLELFDKIINKKLSTQIEKQQNSERNIDEKLLHNLIFCQGDANTMNTDLWLINEDFIYFKGNSEHKLKDVAVNGVKLLKDIENLTKEEQEFRKSLNEDRYEKRPDILLFPEENKCIIIEFKNPNVSVSEHLTQINNYASLIWNFAKSEFNFDTFYGYLIGEKINSFDVRSHDGLFQEAYNFDYLFKPYYPINGFFAKDRNNASLYTEVITYSTLQKRAEERNKIFTRKLLTK
ncbi:MAG: hypothetical protein LBI82_12265 [Dysgonamonadaceae bacterium]|jgi:hypothetical protein|nr:hypothetical protein [Dysgonamonadaceae bacterium]